MPGSVRPSSPVATSAVAAESEESGTPRWPGSAGERGGKGKKRHKRWEPKAIRPGHSVQYNRGGVSHGATNAWWCVFAAQTAKIMNRPLVEEKS